LNNKNNKITIIMGMTITTIEITIRIGMTTI
jgi:hypothetical protein